MGVAFTGDGDGDGNGDGNGNGNGAAVKSADHLDKHRDDSMEQMSVGGTRDEFHPS